MNLGRRVELHSHSFLSDGDLIPSEILRRAEALGYEAIAITDHVDASNLEHVITKLVKFAGERSRCATNIGFIQGVELTHVHPDSIDRLARDARKLGALLVIAHGESIVEPVMAGTNHNAASSTEIDILAHPGLITVEDAELARGNGVYLELTSRNGHCLTNGHVAQVALRAGAELVVDTDLHSPSDFITQEDAYRVALGAGLKERDALKIIRENPQQLLKNTRK